MSRKSEGEFSFLEEPLSESNTSGGSGLKGVVLLWAALGRETFLGVTLRFFLPTLIKGEMSKELELARKSSQKLLRRNVVDKYKLKNVNITFPDFHNAKERESRIYSKTIIAAGLSKKSIQCAYIGAFQLFVNDLRSITKQLTLNLTNN